MQFRMPAVERLALDRASTAWPIRLFEIPKKLQGLYLSRKASIKWWRFELGYTSSEEYYVVSEFVGKGDFRDCHQSGDVSVSLTGSFRVSLGSINDNTFGSNWFTYVCIVKNR